MDITVSEYKADSSRWNNFVANSNNGTLFHNLDFLSYHGPKFAKNERHLMFHKDSNIIGLMPLAVFQEGEKLIGKSPYGGSYGGIVEDGLTFSSSESLVQVMMEYFKQSNLDEVYITPPPEIYSKKPSCYLDFNFLKNGFELVNRDITSVLDVGNIPLDPIDIFRPRSKRAIKKTEQSGILVVESSTDLDCFYEILRESQMRHDAKPTHTLDELKKLCELVPGSIKLDLAYVGNAPVAGVLYFVCNPRVILTFYICHKTEYSNVYPTNALLYAGIKRAKKDGFRYFDFGTTTSAMQPRMDLFTFKESFGSVGYFRDTFRWRVKSG